MTVKPIDVWVVDDDASIRWVLEKSLGEAGMQATGFSSARSALEGLGRDSPDVVITDIRMPDMGGLELLDRIHQRWPDLPVIVITAHSDLDSAVAAYSGGAFEYLPKPFDVDEAVQLVRRAAAPDEPGEKAPPTSGMPGLIGQAPAMQEVFRAIGRLSRSSMTVLITGESGTGKELVASALHQHSPRASGPFIAINTSAIPSELLESELFGHERGAFTGADARRIGRFEQASGGTLFLDEIGDMPAGLQTRLLRVLAEGEFYRVGGQQPVAVDVRVMAATHHDLSRRVREGAFREDLFHRLNVIRVAVPPLRERRGDIPVLLSHYLTVAAEQMGVPLKRLSANAEARLVGHHWPGNVRELVNACQRLTALAPGNIIHEGDIPKELGGESGGVSIADGWARQLARWAEARLERGGAPLLADALPEFERTLIRTTLARVGGKRQEAARLLGWGRNTLTRKIRELEL